MTVEHMTPEQYRRAVSGESKYKNQKTEVDGIRFDSAREARRYAELKIKLKAGEISNLRLQPEFTLQDAYHTATGERVGAIRYRGDFLYVENGSTIVEDAKGVRTQVYIIKRKMMLEKYNIKIREI
jgi:hypothetical protein